MRHCIYGATLHWFTFQNVIVKTATPLELLNPKLILIFLFNFKPNPDVPIRSNFSSIHNLNSHPNRKNSLFRQSLFGQHESLFLIQDVQKISPDLVLLLI